MRKAQEDIDAAKVQAEIEAMRVRFTTVITKLTALKGKGITTENVTVILKEGFPEIEWEKPVSDKHQYSRVVRPRSMVDSIVSLLKDERKNALSDVIRERLRKKA